MRWKIKRNRKHEWCNKCKCYKPYNSFNKNKRNWNGISDWCKKCNKSYSKKRRQSADYNKKMNEYYKKRMEDPEYREKKRVYRRKYQSSQKSKCKRNAHYKNKRKNDIWFKMRGNLSRLIRYHLKLNNSTKSKNTLLLLGCDITTFKSHIQSLFKEGMEWNNYGRKGWHLDHILSCTFFDLSKVEEQRKCFHYTNLQPLWWYENLSKSDFLPDGKHAKCQKALSSTN